MDEKNIAIVGAGQIGKTVLSKPIEQRIGSLSLMSDDGSFAIKDKRYISKPRKQPHSNRIIRSLVNQYFKNEFTDTEDYLIIKEFRLVQEKKSKLSSKKRDLIVSEFNWRFKEIE